MKWSGIVVPDDLKAAVVLALILVLVYGEIIFFGYTLNPGLWNYGVLNVPQYGYNGRWLSYQFVMDPLATGGQNWPMYALISRTLTSGKIPLWNPYQGTGAPLAADTSWSTYFPIDILYVINNQYWDFIWILKLWIAGTLCYLFLKKLGLRWLPAIGGGIAYALSGAFIFYPSMPWTNVAIMTPALLLVAKRCFDQPFNRGVIVLGSLVFVISLLGAHIEALVIQFLYVILFVLFMILTTRKQRMRGIATWAASILLGVGLGAFFLLPVLEYLREAAFGHPAGWGLSSLSTGGNPATWWLTLFVPYFYGSLQTYPYDGLRQVFFWDISPGYLGTTVFLLSLLPLFSIRQLWKRERTRYYLFFIVAEILILMKVFGVPPINWIGFLPVLAYVIFPRYCGSVLAMSFAGACAYGLTTVETFAKRSSTKASSIVLVTFGLALYATTPFPASPSNPFFVVSLAYLALSIFFLILSSRVASKGGPVAARILLVLIILELTSYVPKSLPVRYEGLRVATLAAAAGVIFIAFRTRGSRRFPVDFPASLSKSFSFARILSNQRLLAVILVLALVLQFTVSGASPQGFPSRYDAFTEAPYVRFLQANVGYQRIYSLDGVLFPPVAGVFSLQNLGEFSAFMPSSFRIFSLANLDRGSAASTLVGNAWARVETISPSQEIGDNIEFYSLLGVKYFVTVYTDLGDRSLPVVYHDQNATIYQNLKAFPRAFLVDNAVAAKNEEEAVLKTRGLGWSTRETVVLEEPLSTQPILTNASKGTSASPVEIERYSPSEVAIRVEASASSFLVLTDTFYPGWTAYVDGRSETIYRAYGVVRAVFVTAGSHEVLFRYECDSFRLGIAITVASASLVVILCATRVGPFKDLLKKTSGRMRRQRSVDVPQFFFAVRSLSLYSPRRVMKDCGKNSGLDAGSSSSKTSHASLLRRHFLSACLNSCHARSNSDIVSSVFLW